MKYNYDIYINAKNLKCPQPLLLVKLEINKLNNGEIIFLEATDPHTDLDLEVWCERFNHTLIYSLQQNSIFKFWIKKG